ncbi:uncharacterized protein I303_105798 [Kwoniella dejecticola CBS 10117]|uniref:Uncharacterized protein n=1 Tax=Kwoniella dejecticola CBS 10117 TaxID=1296121 RepID=A0A1A6A0F0_9TREE|nr:uncharacterized protein I303_05820 [Kwoniella dejecticola CBS 10117]OBR83540.1 hypothetical protein I303_05820 [Kwoniella dejecticola CBS 10117]
MSLLPQYKSDATHENHEESVPLWAADNDYKHHDSGEDEESLPGYPPQPIASGSGNNSGNASQGRVHNISYVYVKARGPNEEALGVLGRTKDDTVEIVKRGFSELAAIPSERIKLQIPSQQPGREGQWVSILDEAWPQFQDDPPKSLRVKVDETPEETKDRERTETAIGCVIISLVIAVVLYLIFQTVGGSNGPSDSNNATAGGGGGYTVTQIRTVTETATVTM